MFKGLKDMGSLMKQAKEMKSQMSKVQEGLKKMAFSGTALQGKIEITVNGELDILNVKIDRILKGIWKYSGVARVDGNVVAEAQMMCILKAIDKKEK